MADSIAQYFKPIDHNFLDKEWEQGFEVFYQAGSGDKIQYLKFADYTPNEYSRLYQIMEEKDRQNFFIHENDLYRYYKELVLKKLDLYLYQENPVKEKTKRIYSTAHRILSDYLEIKTSEKILTLLDNLPLSLVELFNENPVSFPELHSIANKEGFIHTHCVNVGFSCLSMGYVLKLPEKELCDLFLGGMFSDIGKKFISQEVLEKKGPLVDDDLKAIRKHCSYGRKILNDTKRYSEIVLRMVGEHHENFDGTGYPFGYAGEKISFHGRICKIMDVFNALTSKRSYRERLNPVQALSIMKNDMVGQFDQNLLMTFLNSLAHK